MGQELAHDLGVIDKAFDKKAYQELQWEGSFEDYLKIIDDAPRVVRNAFQRLYDMILSYGSERDINYRKIAEYGSNSDLRAFNFDGEFNVPNWCVIEFIEGPKKANLTLMQKLKLYNGKTLPGYTEDNIKDLRDETHREDMERISPSHIQDTISSALVKVDEAGCVNPFMVFNELEEGLLHHSLILSEDQKKRFKELLADMKGEYEDIVKNEVQRAICADEEAINRIFMKAYTQRQKVKNKYTGQDEEPQKSLKSRINGRAVAWM